MSDFDSDDEPPPLVTAAPGASAAPPPVAVAADATKATKAATAAPAAAKSAPPPKPAAESGGLKKGFLNGGGSTKKKAPPRKPAADVPLVKPQSSKDAAMRLPEVQAAMSGEGSAAAGLAGGGAKDGWVTPELMQKIMASPILRKAFTDPRCAAAMEQLQKDPAGAMRTHGDNAEMREFLQAFMKLMGEHFSGLADAQEKEKASAPPPPKAPLTAEERKAQQAAEAAQKDPEVMAILADPEVQKVLSGLQMGRGTEVDQKLAQRADLVMKLKRLAHAGLINMEWRS